MRPSVTITTLMLGAALVAAPAVLDTFGFDRPLVASHDIQVRRLLACFCCWVVGAEMIAVSLPVAIWSRFRSQTPVPEKPPMSGGV